MLRPVQQTAITVTGWLCAGRRVAAGTLVGVDGSGVVHIFIHPISDEAREAALAGLAAIRDEHPAAVATLIDGEHAGRKLYIDAGSTVGSLGAATLLDDNVTREARGLTVQGRSTVRSYGLEGASLGSGLRVHVAAFAEPTRSSHTNRQAAKPDAVPQNHVGGARTSSADRLQPARLSAASRMRAMCEAIASRAALASA